MRMMALKTEEYILYFSIYVVDCHFLWFFCNWITMYVFLIIIVLHNFFNCVMEFI
jgi:hypothetical protein